MENQNNKSAKNSSGKKKRQRKRLLHRLLATAAALAVLVALAALAAVKFYTVKSVTVKLDGGVENQNGGLTYYTAEQIASVSGIESGDSVPALSADGVSSQVTKSLPYISTCKIKKKLSGDIEITVTEETPRYYVSLGELRALLGKNFKVLEMKADKPEGAAELTGVEFVSLVPGEYAEFKDSMYKNRITEITDKCDECGIGQITSIDLSYIAGIKVVFMDRITVNFGNINNLDEKTDTLKKTVDSALKENPNAFLSINVSAGEEAFVRDDEDAKKAFERAEEESKRLEAMMDAVG